jgi:hypothetical protein
VADCLLPNQTWRARLWNTNIGYDGGATVSTISETFAKNLGVEKGGKEEAFVRGVDGDMVKDKASTVEVNLPLAGGGVTRVRACVTPDEKLVCPARIQLL